MTHTSEMNDIKLGREIKFSKILVRVHDAKFNPPKAGNGYGKSWIEKEFPITEGIIIGKRKLQNGAYYYPNDYDESGYFKAKQYIDAVLVAYHISRKPILIPITTLKKKIFDRGQNIKLLKALRDKHEFWLDGNKAMVRKCVNVWILFKTPTHGGVEYAETFRDHKLNELLDIGERWT